MRPSTLLFLAIPVWMFAQSGPTIPPPPPVLPRIISPEEARLPNGKLEREEILRIAHEEALKDARELSRLAKELESELEKSDPHELSFATVKRAEKIDKLARRIRDRLKH